MDFKAALFWPLVGIPLRGVSGSRSERREKF
jgi:hypothetical protein